MLSKSLWQAKSVVEEKEEAKKVISFQSKAFNVVSEGRKVVYGFVMNHAAQLFFRVEQWRFFISFSLQKKEFNNVAL